jgi:hypothetical protein
MFLGDSTKSRRTRWTGNVARMGEKKNASKVFVGKQEVKRPLGRLRIRWEDNIKMDLRDIGWGDMGFIRLALNRGQWMALVNTVMNLRVP